MKKHKRVVITGYGVSTPFGFGINYNWDNLIKAKSCIKFITEFDTNELRTKFAGTLAKIDPDTYPKKINPKNLDKTTLYTLLTIKETLESAKLKPEEKNSIGLILGTGFGTILSKESHHFRVMGEKKPPFPLIIPKAMDNAAASEAAIFFGLNGINQTVFSACSSGLNAIGNAYRLIKDGYETAIIAGGVDTPVSFWTIQNWNKLRVLSTYNKNPEKASKPFSKDRDGFVLSEGAGFLMLECYDNAIQRNAPILAEIIGFGSTCDAKHITAPGIEQQCKAIEKAIVEAGIQKKEIDYINAHGTATKLNDLCETEVIKKVFKDYAYKIPVSSTKSQLGHTIGASGALEVIFSIKMMQSEIILPTINLDEQDELCDLDYVPNKPIKHKVKYFLKNSFGFGGSNAALIIKKV